MLMSTFRFFSVLLGFVVDPLKLQGGGCTSFANAIVQRSGLDFPLQQFWYRDVFIPVRLPAARRVPSSGSACRWHWLC